MSKADPLSDPGSFKGGDIQEEGDWIILRCGGDHGIWFADSYYATYNNCLKVVADMRETDSEPAYYYIVLLSEIEKGIVTSNA